MKMPLRLTLLFLFFIAVAAQAKITWKTDTKEVTILPNQSSVDIEYPFVNSGSETVKIEATKTSCSCADPILEKKQYKAGEKGVLKVRFTPGVRTGLQEKQVLVQTSDSDKPQKLTMRVTIQPLLTITPVNLTWDASKATDGQTVEVKAGSSIPVHITKLSFPDDRVDAQLTPVKDGSHYQVTVKPKVTGKPFVAVIQLVTDFPSKASPRLFNIFATVK